MTGHHVTLTLDHATDPDHRQWRATITNNDGTQLLHGHGWDPLHAVIDLAEQLGDENEARAWHLPDDYIDLADRDD